MIEDRIVVYRAGAFMSEPHPAWFLAIRAAAKGGQCWDESVVKVLGHASVRLVIGSEGWPTGELRVHATPEGGRFVELMEGEYTFAEVWVPDLADWLPFNAAYIEPYLLTRATLHTAERIDRLANAIIAFVRHGEGRHIERETGESRIDHREDAERYRRERAAQYAASTITITRPEPRP